MDMLLEWGDPTGPQTEMNAGQNRVAPKTTQPRAAALQPPQQGNASQPGQTMRLFTSSSDMG
jgi:hypothetical protein